MKSKCLVVCLLAVVLAFMPLLSSAVSAEQASGKKVEAKAQKSRGTGIDENIKSKAVTNNPKVSPAAPPAKGGTKSRGYCAPLYVDNRTPWKIQIYVDGSYVGMVSPWGDASGTYYADSKLVLYAVAEFLDGSRLTWGPQYAYCSDGPFTWKLTE
jgi:hypothetical protein